MKSSVRIAVDASSLLTRHPRGEGRSLLRLYEEMARIRPQWHFIFFGMQMSGAAAEIGHRIPGSIIRIFNLPGHRWNLWMNLGLPVAARLSGAKLLHCSSSGSPPWSLVPIVMTVHDVIPLLMNDGASDAAVTHFRRGLKAGVRLARRIITVSNNTQQDLIRLMHPDPNKLAVVHWGVDMSAYAASPMVAEAKSLVLGFGGGGSDRKNTAMLISMFARVATRHPTITLAILGVSNAAQHAELQGLVEQLSLQDRVMLLGYVSDAELEGYYSRAACLVYISLYEGFGLPPLEAMARGVPVIASNCSSIPEVVGDAGLLVDPRQTDAIAAAVQRVLDDKDLRCRLAQQAWRRARNFDWRETAAKTVEVFESALRSEGA